MARRGPALTKVKSVRMGPVEEEVIRQEAEHEGIPFGQFVRDAAYARALWSMARRQADPGQAWQDIVRLVEAAASDEGAIDAATADGDGIALAARIVVED